MALSPDPTVYVVDDDHGVRRSLERLLRVRGYRPRTYPSGPAFLADEEAHGDERDGPSCVVVDLRMPEMSGLTFHERLSERRSIPVIFLTAHADVPTSVRAMKAGAVDFLQKPVDEEDLVSAVDEALARDRARLLARDRRALATERLARLTKRESEVTALVAEGLKNREIGERLGIAERTVKVHRGRVMKKLEVTSVPDLVRLRQEAE